MEDINIPFEAEGLSLCLKLDDRVTINNFCNPQDVVIYNASFDNREQFRDQDCQSNSAEIPWREWLRLLTIGNFERVAINKHLQCVTYKLRSLKR